MNIVKKLFEPVDMTMGKPWEKILLFTAPMILGNIAQQLYNTVDSIVVGKYIGDNALAAVGSAGPIVNLLLVLFVGVSVGASIMVSQYFGARDRENLSQTVGTSILLTGIVSLIIMVMATLLSRPLLQLLGTPDSIIDWCTDYLHILFIGIAGMAYYNILSGILRGLGDSMSALGYLLVACVLNSVLDVVFVGYVGLGVPGVALATAIAQAISAVLCIRRLYKMKDIFVLEKRHYRLSKHHAAGIIRLGVPSGITQAIMSMAMLVVQSLTNSFGEMFIAANVIVMRVDGFAMMPNFSFGTAMTTYAGQNVGARQPERVHQGAKQGTLLAMGISASIVVVILAFGKPLMGIFTDTEELVNLSMNMMRILAVGYVAVGVTQSLSGVMRGAGDTMTPMWISMFTTIVLRIPVAYGLAYLTRSAAKPNGEQASVFISLLVTWVIGAILTSIVYKRGRWMDKAKGMID